MCEVWECPVQLSFSSVNELNTYQLINSSLKGNWRCLDSKVSYKMNSNLSSFPKKTIILFSRYISLWSRIQHRPDIHHQHLNHFPNPAHKSADPCQTSGIAKKNRMKQFHPIWSRLLNQIYRSRAFYNKMRSGPGSSLGRDICTQRRKLLAKR